MGTDNRGENTVLKRFRGRTALVVTTCLGLLTTGFTAPAAHAVPGLHWCPSFSGLDSNPAADVMAGNIVIPGFASANVPGLDVGSGIDWSADPYANSSWRIWFHSLLWLGNVEELGVRRHDQTYIDRAVSVTKDYLANNPITTESPQRNSMAHRTVWLGCLAEVSDDPTIHDAALAYAGYLIQHWSGAWNWGLDEDLGVMTVGCALNHPELAAEAGGQLTDVATAMFDAEGVTNEQSPGYGRYSYDRWKVVTTLMYNCALTPAFALTDRLAKASNFFAAATQPDGHVVQLGDTVDEPMKPIPGTSLDYAASGGTIGTAPTDRVSIFSAGYIFGRSTWTPMSTASYYSLRFGRGKRFHGHNDHMSLTYWSAGQPIIVDSGHSGYSNSRQRTHLMSPEAHNLMAMDGLIGANGTHTYLTRSDVADTYDAFSFSGTPYADSSAPYGRVYGTRNILIARGPDFVVTYDRQSTRAASVHDYKGRRVLATRLVHRQLWHLPAGGAEPLISGRGQATAGAVTFLRIPLPGESLPAGGILAYPSYVAPQLNVTQSDWVVSLPSRGRNAAVLSVIVPAGTASATIVSVGTTGFTLRVTIDAVAHDVRITNSGSMTRLS